MQYHCNECKQPVDKHEAQVRWVDGKWEVVSVQEDSAVCPTCGYVAIYEDDGRKDFDVMFVLKQTMVKTIRAESAQEAEFIVRNMQEWEMFAASHLEIEEPLILQVTEAD